MYSEEDAPFGVVYQPPIIKVDLVVRFSVPFLIANSSVVVSAFRVDDDVSVCAAKIIYLNSLYKYIIYGFFYLFLSLMRNNS